MRRVFTYVVLPSLLLISSFATLALAQTAPSPTAAPKTQNTQALATVNIQHAKLSQQGNVVQVSFDLTNRVGEQHDVHYAIQLIGSVNNKQYVADQKAFVENVTLKENSTLHKDVTFVASAGLSGTYMVLIVSQNSSGFPFGAASAGKVTLSPATGVEIISASCFLQVEGEKSAKHYSLRQGVDIAADENLVLQCAAVNHSKSSVVAVPQFETHLRSVFGEIVDQVGGDTTSVSLAPGEQKLVSFKLPKTLKPQAYDVRFTLKANTTDSNSIAAHYVLRGASATIQTLILDKTTYGAGDIATLSFVWTSSADGFPGARNGGSKGATSFVATLTDSSGVACAEPVLQSLSNSGSRVSLSMPVSRACHNPHVSVTLKDSTGALLAQKDISIESAGEAPHTSWSWLLGIIATLVLFGYTLLRFKNLSAIKSKTVLPVLFACLALGAMTPTHFAKADTFCTAGYHFYNDGSGNAPWYDECLYYYSVNLDSNTYAPSDTILASGQVQTSMCANEIDSGGNYSQSKIDGDAPYSGESHVVIDGSPEGDRYVDTDEGFAYCTSGKNLCYGNPLYGSANYTAPNAEGDYSLHFTGTGWFYDQDHNSSSLSNSINIPFKVKGSASANPCPPGQSLDGGVCAPPIRPGTGGTCQAGYVLNKGGACVSGALPTSGSCPSGMIYDPASDVCKQPSECSEDFGANCASAPNSCNMYDFGTYDCSGSCWATTPSESLCPTPVNAVLSLTATPGRVRSGASSLLSWSAENVRSCTVTGTNGFSSNKKKGEDENSGIITTATTFTFTCKDKSGNTSTISQTVQPLPVFNER